MMRLLLSLALVSILCGHSSAAEAPMPNIVFLFADDLGGVQKEEKEKSRRAGGGSGGAGQLELTAASSYQQTPPI